MKKEDKQSKLDFIKAKQQMLYNAYYEKRTEQDLDLVEIIGNFIGEQVGEDYKEAFLNDPAVIAMKDKKPGVQRVILNKYLTITLLRYAGITGNSVFDVVSYVIFNDGTHQQWFDWLNAQLMPFCKQFNVFETIYPEVNKK